MVICSSANNLPRRQALAGSGRLDGEAPPRCSDTLAISCSLFGDESSCDSWQVPLGMNIARAIIVESSSTSSGRRDIGRLHSVSLSLDCCLYRYHLRQSFLVWGLDQTGSVRRRWFAQPSATGDGRRYIGLPSDTVLHGTCEFQKLDMGWGLLVVCDRRDVILRHPNFLRHWESSARWRPCSLS